MPFNLSFAGAVNTDLSAAGIGLSKLSGDTGAFRLSGWGRAFRAVNTAVQYQHSEVITNADYKVTWGFFVDSTTVAERWGVTLRDTTTVNTNRNMILSRIRTEASTAAFIELYKCVGNVFTLVGTSNLTIAANTPYEFVTEVEGSAVRVKQGASTLINYTITDSVLLNAGKVGLYASPNDPVSTAGASDGTGTGSHLQTYNFDYLVAGLNANLDKTLDNTSVVATAGSPQSVADLTKTVDSVIVSATADNGVPVPTTTLLSDIHGANCSPTGTTITNPTTLNPVVDLVMRNPEGGTYMWQHFLFGLSGCAGKTITVNVSLANKEGGTTILSTWSGPYKANTMNDWQAWTPIARSATAGVLTFTITGDDDTVYISSMPPNTRGQMESWMSYLESTYPSFMHDDLPSRIAQGGDAYVVDIAPTVVDELGRTSTNQPMFGFRIGDDTFGTPKQKKRMILMSSRHPGEHHGFLQLQGYIDRWLTSSDPLIVEARKRIELWVYPQQAVNGIALGYRRHEPRVGFAQGDDINREWLPNSLNDIADYWREVFNTDHGVGYDLVEGMIDFHDLSYSTQLIVYYYRAETPQLTELRAVIDSKFTGEISSASNNENTATDWFVNTKGVGPSFTAEVSDEATSLTGFRSAGGTWADITAEWQNQGLLGNYTDASVTLGNVTLQSDASVTLNIDLSINLQDSTVSASSSVQILTNLNSQLDSISIEANATTAEVMVADLNSVLGGVGLQSSVQNFVGAVVSKVLDSITVSSDVGVQSPEPIAHLQKTLDSMALTSEIQSLVAADLNKQLSSVTINASVLTGAAPQLSASRSLKVRLASRTIKVR